MIKIIAWWLTFCKSGYNLTKSPRLFRQITVKKFRIFKDGYAFLNDEGHYFSALHCCINQTLQRRQLAEKKFAELDVLDEFCNSVSETDNPKSSPHLMYVAKKIN